MAAFTALAIAALAGTAVSAYGQLKAGDQAKKAGEAGQAAANDQGDLADFNAHVADLQAADAIARGTEAENRFRAGVRGLIGSQRATIASGNVDVSFGSAIDVQGDAAKLGELDALTIRTNAAREAWGYNVQAADLRRQGIISRKEGVNLAAAGKSGQTQARIGAAGTLLGTGVSLLQTRYGLKGH